MDRRKRIILATADVGIGAVLIYLIIKYMPTFGQIDFSILQLAAIMGSAVIGIFLVYHEPLKTKYPETIKSMELLMLIIPPTVAGFPFLAKVNLFLIPAVYFAVVFGWFIFGLTRNNPYAKIPKEKSDKNIVWTSHYLICILIVLGIMVSWLVTTYCGFQHCIT
jgi:hypothetical protein